MASRVGREQHSQSLPCCCTSQPEMCASWCAQQLGAETQASATYSGRELGFAVQRRPKGPGAWSGPQLGLRAGQSAGLQ